MAVPLRRLLLFKLLHNDTIVINARLSCDQQRECFEHEVGHIGNGDLDKEGSADAIEVAAHRR